MLDKLYDRRFSVFLLSFLVLIFGDLLLPAWDENLVQTLLLAQNIAFSFILFIRESIRVKRLVGTVFLISIVTRLTPLIGYDGSMGFAMIYIIYFVLISYQILKTLQKQPVVGIEMISAAFCGYILLGVLASIVFFTIDRSSEAFTSTIADRAYADYLYFSFITLLTIGYGDITPVSELAQKLVIITALIGHFYTVFVMAVVIGKYLKSLDKLP